MTANAMPGDREAYIEAGMDGYLPKPIELADLAALLDQVALLTRQPAGGPAHEGLDIARLEHLRTLQDQSQPHLVRELIDLFLGDSAGHVRRIVQAHAEGDAAALRALAHRFLSATQNIGAHELSRLCADIEGLAKAGDLVAVARLLPGVERERERAQLALQALRIRY
jgi:HPt (histidine-containing phosphotransfer) domain-containing protein